VNNFIGSCCKRFAKSYAVPAGKRKVAVVAETHCTLRGQNEELFTVKAGGTVATRL
jgi:hypothetical protein